MITLHPSNWSLCVGLLASAAVLLFAWKHWSYGERGWRLGLVEGLRVLCVFYVVFLLWEPRWTVMSEDSKVPAVVVLWDASGSMKTVDASAGKEPEQIKARERVVTELLADARWSELETSGRCRVVKRAFGQAEGSAAPVTNIAAAVEGVLNDEAQLKAVVLMSDGDHNVADSPIAAAQRMKSRGVPLFPVLIGNPKAMPDLEIVAVSAPLQGVLNERVQIPFVIRSAYERPIQVQVELRDAKGKVKSKEVTLAPGAETVDSLSWNIEAEGATKLELSVPLLPDETVVENNRVEFDLLSRKEKIKVLVLEGLPRWEYRFLRNALSRDAGVELFCMQFHPELGCAKGSGYLTQFPEQKEVLSTFDVIMIGDVGVNQLTSEQCELIRGVVENQATGLVWLPGSQGHQDSLKQTALKDLFPVYFNAKDASGKRVSGESTLRLTEEGRGSLLMMLGQDEIQNAQIWKSLPGFVWHANPIQAKAGASVLAVSHQARDGYQESPLVVANTAGRGKVLYVGMDSAWRWRRGVEDLYHYRFWGQVTRWMAYQRNMAEGQRLRMSFSPERPKAGSSVILDVNAFDATGSPVKTARIVVDLLSPSGRVRRIELKQNQSAWGAFSGVAQVDEPGPWQVRAVMEEAPDAPLQAMLSVQASPIEKVGRSARREVLAAMAEVTGGQVGGADELGGWLKAIDALPVIRRHERVVEIGTHWLSLLVGMVLLSAFWISRKRLGLY